MFICHHTSCCQAISTSRVNRHLRDNHQVDIKLRKQIDHYLQQWQWPYNLSSLPLPPAKSAPQPILPIIEGFQCLDCEYLTQSRKLIRVHRNQKHDKQRGKDNELFTKVFLQTWVKEKRARYWAVSRATTTGSGTVQEEEEGSLEVSRSGSNCLDLSTRIKTEVTTWIK